MLAISLGGSFAYEIVGNVPTLTWLSLPLRSIACFIKSRKQNIFSKFG